MRFVLYTLFLFLITITNVYAQNSAPDDLFSVKLIPEHTHVSSGDELWIGIEQTIKPGWHTYWKNPGDSGSVPNVNWSAPDGFTFGDIVWPTPKKLPYGSLLNYGYEGRTVLLQKLSIPTNIPEGTLTLTADLDILVCQVECIPVSLTETLILNTSNTDAIDNTKIINSALKKVPEIVEIDAGYYEEEGALKLIINHIGSISGDQINPDTLTLFPADWGIVDNAALPDITINGDQLILSQTRGDRGLSDIDNINATIRFDTVRDQTHAYDVTISKLDNATSTNIEDTSETVSIKQNSEHTFLTALLFAMLGGMILNLMPCVFPVLSLKALSLSKLQDKEHKIARRNGLAYTAGIVLSFLAIATVLVTLKTLGAQIGWGFQLQNPIIVALLAYTLFLVGLNFAGGFDLSFGTLGGGKLSQKLTGGSGTSASFFTGVLAAVVAAPCVAPFMASAIGYALTKSTGETLLIFAALGFGLAAPYLLLCYVPGLQKFMPKPGAWMNTFKQFLAFPMFASAAWLVWVLSKQAGNMAVLGALLGMTGLAFGIWLLGHRPASGNKWRGLVTFIAALSILMAFGFLPSGYKSYDPDRTEKESVRSTKNFGEPFSPAYLDEMLTTNRPVFVEMTAAWCITCKVNHKTSINIDATKRLFADENVAYLIGDWTNQDPEITKYLEYFGRSGVPIYVFYGRPDNATGLRPDPVVLPQILTPGIVKKAILRSES